MTLRPLLLATLLCAHAASWSAPVQPLTRDSVPQLRAKLAGQPWVVHIWGMACAPCRKELPQWGQLAKRLPRMKLVLVQVDPASPANIDRTLAKVGLSQAESLTIEGEPDEYLRASVDARWQGDTPHTLLIAPDGSVQRIQGMADLAKVRQWLETSRR